MNFIPMTDTAEMPVNINGVETLLELVIILTGHRSAEVDGVEIDARVLLSKVKEAMTIDGIDGNTGFLIGDGDYSKDVELLSTAYGEEFQLGDYYAVESGEHAVMLVG